MFLYVAECKSIVFTQTVDLSVAVPERELDFTRDEERAADCTGDVLSDVQSSGYYVRERKRARNALPARDDIVSTERVCAHVPVTITVTVNVSL